MSEAADGLWVALGLAAGALGLLGLGSMLIAALEATAEVSLSTRCWLGVVTALAMLEPLHLMVPVGGLARTGLLVAAVTGLWLQRVVLARLLRGLRGWHGFALAAGVLCMARLALGPGPEGDSALYHYPAVRWAVSYPVVPGVGNLNPFLGYSHGNVLLLAALDGGPFAFRSHHLLNPLLVLLTGARCVSEAIALLTPRPTISAVVGTAALSVVFDGLGSQWLVSPSSNLGESMFVIVLMLEVLSLMQGHLEARPWVVALLAVGAVVFKLSAAVVGAAAFVFALSSLKRWPRSARWGGALTALLAGVGWLWGGAVRTGYVLYPAVKLALPVDWRMDPAVPASVTRYILAYTRRTFHRFHLGQDDGDWVGPWLERASLDNDLLVPALITACCIGLSLCWKESRRRLGWLLPTTLGLAGWVILSPDVQYLGAMLVLQTAVALGVLLHHRQALTAPLSLSLLGALVWVSTSNFPKPRPGGLMAAPTYPTVTRQVIGGTMREPANLYCGATELPCASLVEPGLRYRVAGEVGQGFSVRTPEGELPPGFKARWVLERDFLLGPPR